MGAFDTDNPAATLGRTTLPFIAPYIFRFMGGLAPGHGGMEQWGLHRRIALRIVRRRHRPTAPAVRHAGGHRRRVASPWSSHTAIVVAVVTIGIALRTQPKTAEGLELEQFGAALMLAVAYGSNIGGIGTKSLSLRRGRLATAGLGRGLHGGNPRCVSLRARLPPPDVGNAVALGPSKPPGTGRRRRHRPRADPPGPDGARTVGEVLLVAACGGAAAPR
ncbi:transporter permease [Myxococcus dinghuensis]|uniref:hypothetical protein n=1 Tax=Myxococcus dinghuensis TaxID=2906761 RepID=UPI0020A82145|nr:hypothetical protein [Myxococcus dinghuensis]